MSEERCESCGLPMAIHGINCPFETARPSKTRVTMSIGGKQKRITVIEGISLTKAQKLAPMLQKNLHSRAKIEKRKNGMAAIRIHGDHHDKLQQLLNTSE